MLFVGQTRFSLFRPEDPSWRLSQKESRLSEAAYKARLYDDDRLALRSKIFLEHTVPTLQEAADRSGDEVVHLVSYSESLPSGYQDKLHEAAAAFPILRLDPQQDGKMGSRPSDLARSRTEPREIFGVYRLDDDDVLPITFFEYVGQYMKPEMVGMLVSLPRGIEGIAYRERVLNLREGYYPMHSMGLMQVCAFDENGDLEAPRPAPHDKSDRQNPVIIDSRNIGYFRINHAGQDHRLQHGREVDLRQIADRMRRFESWHNGQTVVDLFPTLSEIVGYTDPWEGSLSKPVTLRSGIGSKLDRVKNLKRAIYGAWRTGRGTRL